MALESIWFNRLVVVMEMLSCIVVALIRPVEKIFHYHMVAALQQLAQLPIKIVVASGNIGD